MRKTSQDAGDSTSITSGFENELKKTSVGIIKTKRNSLKRKVQNLSHESDDTVIEPLLQIDKNETANRSAKYLLSKSKTDSVGERDNIYSDNNIEKSSAAKYICTTSTIPTNTNTNISKTLHNHMNTNVFGGHSGSKVVTTVKSPVLVEISGSKPAIHSNETSSIFTTAKIHADNMTKNMEPIQVTPVPILSTVEGNIVKAGISTDYGKNKTITPSTSSGLLKSTPYQGKVQLSNTQQYDSSHSTQSGFVKSDSYRPSTEHILNKLSDVLDKRSSVKTTESELYLLNKSCDTKKENVTVSSMDKTVDTDKVSKITLQPQSSINTSLDKKIIQEQHHNDLKGNLKSLQKAPDLKEIDVGGRILLQKQNTSNLKSSNVKDLGFKKTEDKNISSTSSGSKQLQRQKNAICENDKLDDVINNDSLKLSKDIFSTATDEIEKQLILSTEMPINKPKDNLTKSSAPHKLTLESGKMPISSTQSSKPITENVSPILITKDVGFKATDSVQPVQSPGTLKLDSLKEIKATVSSSVISKPTNENSLLTNITSKDVSTKSIASFKPTQSSTSFRSDLAIEKKIVVSPREITKPVIDNSSLTTATTKGVFPKSTVTVQPKSSTPLIQPDSQLKEKLVAKPSESSKLIPEKTSIIAVTTKGLYQKSTTTVTTTQTTDPIKSDSTKENKIAVCSSQIARSAVENSSPLTATSKAATQQSNTTTQPTKSTTPIQSVSVKDTKMAVGSVQNVKSVKEKSVKEVAASRSTTTSAIKSPIATNAKGSATANNTKTLKNAPVSKQIPEVGASSCVSTDLKSIVVSKPHKTDKVQNKTLTQDKSITAVPTSNIPIVKTEATSKPSIVPPSSIKSSVIAKVEPNTTSSVTSSSTVSSIPTTTNITTSTLAKSTSQKITSKTNLLDKHGKI